MNLSHILKEHIIKPYSIIAGVYQEKHFYQPEFEKPLNELISKLTKHSRILDAGCGPGGESKFFTDKDFQVVGVDITPQMLERAKNNVPNAEFKVMDIRRLDYPDSSFDGIWSARTLIHIPSDEIQSTLNEWRRVLKPNGIMCVCVLGGNKEEIEPEYYDATGRTSTFFHYFSEKEIKTNIQQAGFTIYNSYTIYIGEENEPHIFVFAKK